MARACRKSTQWRAYSSKPWALRRPHMEGDLPYGGERRLEERPSCETVQNSPCSSTKTLELHVPLRSDSRRNPPEPLGLWLLTYISSLCGLALSSKLPSLNMVSVTRNSTRAAQSQPASSPAAALPPTPHTPSSSHPASDPNGKTEQGLVTITGVAVLENPRIPDSNKPRSLIFDCSFSLGANTAPLTACLRLVQLS